MLLRWHKRLRVFLAPQQVNLMEISGGLRKRVIKRQTMNVEPVAGMTDWEASLSALKSLLRLGAWRGINVEVVLSGHFVRYALISWSDQLSNKQERLAFLHHCFHMAYGEPSRQWDLRMAQPVPDQFSLASGIGLPLLEALNAILIQAGLQQGGIYPALMIGINQSRNLLRKGPVWFGSVEPGYLCLALLEDGAWKSIGSHAANTSEPGAFAFQLETLIARESTLLGKPDQGWPVVLYWPGMKINPETFSRQVARPQNRMLNGINTGDEHPFQLLAWV